MIVAFIIPTGIGCEIGGHAGDATPAARLIAGICDELIVHPNVVNASDINEMTPNMLYVEGSMLDRLLEGDIGLKRVRSNRILVAVNPPIRPETVNAVSAVRATLGVQAEIVELGSKLRMVSTVRDNVASGEVTGWEKLVEQVRGHDFDALAIASEVEVTADVTMHYFRHGGVNPWGGVESVASRLISEALNKPVAHAPVQFLRYEDNPELYLLNEVVDPRISAEAVSMAYLHCVLKGLARAPRIGGDILGVDALVSPIGCFGRPHRACLERGVPVIVVKENRTVFDEEPHESFIVAENYLEAAGMLVAMRDGISLESLRRPLPATVVRKIEGA